MSLPRRRLISFGFLRDRARAAPPPATEPEPTAPGFSLERFYRDRARNGSGGDALPTFAIRVSPEDFEVADD